MKITPLLAVVVALALTVVDVAAQASALNGAKLNISSIDLTGASSLHSLTLTAATNTTAISAAGTRYDIAAGQVTFSPAAGTAVASVAGSGFGTSVLTTNTSVFSKTLRNPRTRTNVVVNLTNTTVTTLAPFGIFLDDSSQIKGSVTSVSCTRQDAYLSWSGTPVFTTRSGGQSRAKFEGAIAYGDKTGNFSSGCESDSR